VCWRACLLASTACGCAAAGDPTPSASPDSGPAILATVCTECHDLGGVEAFRGYYDADQWRDMVVTMVEHGAKLDERQIDVLVDHLAEAYGSQSP
jgi:hypothetical protein